MTYKNSNFPKGGSIVIMCFSLAVFLWPSIAFTQKYSFTNYGIEDGLAQSQATRIIQDNNHRLVIATFLGINRFDGKTFTPITKDNSVMDFVSVLTIDHSGKIWAGNAKGLYCFYADKATRFVADKHDSLIAASELVADRLDNIWGLRNERLFKISGGSLQYVSVTGGKERITALAINKRGDILAAVLNKGIYSLQRQKWINTIPLVLQKNTYIKRFIADHNDDDAFYISTGTEVLYVSKNTTSKIKVDFQKNGVSQVSCIAQDNSNGLWIGTNKGAYYFKGDSLQYFDGTNGFTNYPVYDIFKDIDNNIWFGTNGAGVFRFDGDGFLIFDQAQGIDEPILQLANYKNNHILMAGGTKLSEYNGKKISQINIPLMDAADVFHCLYTDKENNTWIVTQQALWKETGSNFTRFYPANKSDAPVLFNAMLLDHSQTMWVVARDGCYYWDKGFKKISGINGLCTSLIEMGPDSILAGTSNRLFLVRDKKIDTSFKADFLKGSNILCLKYYKGRIYLGTFNNGLFIWDPHGGPVVHLNEKNGLSSASVYSIDVDKHEVLWVGSGRAVNQFKIKNDGTFEKLINENISNLFVECNQDAILFHNKQVLIGTTKGLLVVKNDLPSKSFTAPYMSIKDVAIYNKQNVKYTYKNGYREPQNLKLAFNNSHLSISFDGVYLKSPKNVIYRYQLSPLDVCFSAQVNNNVVDYPSLPPGNYTFSVRAYNLAGAASNIASFSFQVTPAYYQTASFKVAIVLLLFLTGIATWKYLRAKEDQKRRLIAQLRLEEQVKIRKQTAEDFHDDLGNKLTRINVLAEILYKKIDVSFSDERKIIDQIKENAAALFTGSKHILWALDPDNDRLSEVLTHAKEFGIDLFLNTDISFTSDLTNDRFKEITLPMGYGRNITLILKELFNNALRHSGAKNVNATAFLNDNNNIHIIVEDEGRGFDMHAIKSGNGMRNINNRAKKIKGVIETRSSVNKGTSVTLIIKDIPQLH
jgi:signal transduction histidine kinase/ligand-binding sensor domain-containing protein